MPLLCIDELFEAGYRAVFPQFVVDAGLLEDDTGALLCEMLRPELYTAGRELEVTPTLPLP